VEITPDKKEHITSPEDYQTFQKRCRDWIDFLGLTGWEIRFEHSEDPNNYASCSVNYADRVSWLQLTKNWDGTPVTEDRLYNSSRHEVLELLLAPLRTVARARYVSSDEISQSNHEIIRILETFFDKYGLKPDA